MHAISIPRVRFSSGALEALKYLALASMVIDHVNKALFASSLQWAVPLGRLAMPIFATLMAYNLARPGADAGKTLRRLVLFGALATPFHGVVNGGGFLPLNVMFTFAVAVWCVDLAQQRQVVAMLAAFLVGGLVVDYAWPGVMLVLAAWWFFRRPSPIGAMAIVLSLAAICALVGNSWAFLAVLPLAAATQYTPALPRLRWLFWTFYPAHLALLWSLAR